jgi:hypothetical protein
MKIFKIIGFVALIIVAIPVIVAVLFILFLFYLDMPCDPTLIAKFDVGNKRSISIYEECGWREISAGIYYDVQQAGKVIVPLRLIEFYNLEYIDQFDFEVAYAEDESLIGIYDKSRLFEDVIIVDFKTGKAWPPDFIEPHIFSDRADLLGRLRSENVELFPTPTARPTRIAPTITATTEPTPTSTLVVQPTYYNTPEP